MARGLASALAWVVIFASCVWIADPEVGAGLGAACDVDEQCQGSSCITGICAIGCAESSSCPGGSVCASGLCQLSLDVTLVHPSSPQLDEVTRSFEVGRSETGVSLGYVTFTSELDRTLASDAVATATAAIARGTEVVVATSPSHSAAFAALAAEHPETTVAVFRGADAGIVRIDARVYQAYYLAGVAAAHVTQSNRLGFVASVAEPSVVASVNAFALGAQRELGTAVTVEVRWIGAPHDPAPPASGDALEASLAGALVAAGADVVAHSSDNDRVVAKIAALRAQGSPALAVGANVQTSCSLALAGACVGATYYNWEPVLSALLEGVHRHTLGPEPISLGLSATEDASAVGFAVDSQLPNGSFIAGAVDEVRVELTTDQGTGSIFGGAIRSTGQCPGETATEPCVAAGAELTSEQLDAMCWLVEGVVDELGQPALVPAGCGG